MNYKASLGNSLEEFHLETNLCMLLTKISCAKFTLSLSTGEILFHAAFNLNILKIHMKVAEGMTGTSPSGIFVPIDGYLH